jgi:hypothetical protein
VGAAVLQEADRGGRAGLRQARGADHGLTSSPASGSSAARNRREQHESAAQEKRGAGLGHRDGAEREAAEGRRRRRAHLTAVGIEDHQAQDLDQLEVERDFGRELERAEDVEYELIARHTGVARAQHQIAEALLMLELLRERRALDDEAVHLGRIGGEHAQIGERKLEPAWDRLDRRHLEFEAVAREGKRVEFVREVAALEPPGQSGQAEPEDEGELELARERLGLPPGGSEPGARIQGVDLGEGSGR